MRTRRTAIGPGELDVHEDGPPDGPPVLLLHGFPQRADCWAGVTPALAAAGYRTIAPDQRGYSPGARPTGRAAYPLRALVADALAVVDDAVGPTGRVDVVGHDWGGGIAWPLAARHPDRVRTLTAVSTPAPRALLRSMLGPRQAMASWYIAAMQLPWLPERALAAGGRPYSARFVAALRRSGQTRQRAERDAARLADPAALTATLNWYRGMFVERPGRPDPPVRVPTLLVWSDGDTALLRPAAERTQRHVSGPYRYVELRGVSHWIPEEAPDQLAGLLLEHLAAHP